MSANTRYMGFNWDSARNTDPYYLTAEEEQRVIDEEKEMSMNREKYLEEQVELLTEEKRELATALERMLSICQKDGLWLDQLQQHSYFMSNTESLLARVNAKEK